MERSRIRVTPSHISGVVAVATSSCFLILERGDFSIGAASIYFILACTNDTLKSKIPNLLNAGLLIAGFSLNILSLGMHGLLLSLSGLGLGIGLLLLPYIMGGMGAGDVKALGALGALIGPYDLLHVFVYTGLYGGALALLHYLYETGTRETIRNGWLSFRTLTLTGDARLVLPPKDRPRKESMRFPYATAIAFGYYTFIYWGGVL